MIELKILKHQASQRLDRYLRKELSNYSLNFIFKILRQKKVRLNGKRAKGAEYLDVDDVVHIYEKIELPERDSDFVEISDREIQNKLNIIFENEEFMVVNKKPGMAVHPGTTVEKGQSLIDYVTAYLKPGQDDFKPQLAHRLDMDTSGAILVAKDAHWLKDISSQMRGRTVYKEYRTIVKGTLKEKKGQIKMDLARVNAGSGGAKIVEVSEVAGKAKAMTSVTDYEVLEEFSSCSLVKVVLKTGRMHQIRMHFNHLGHPLLGDNRYGDFKWNSAMKKEFKYKGMFLHSYNISWGKDFNFFADYFPGHEKFLKLVRED